jgi:solute carrier family 12 sodium/potassium/chloride transporter 2
VVYGILLQQKLTTPFEDVRSGLFVSFTEWAAKRASQLTHRQERAWKPNLLIPVSDPKSTKEVFSFLKNIAFPQGSIKLLGIASKSKADVLADQVNELSQAFQKEGVFSSWAVIRTENFAQGVNFSNQAYRGSFIKPNIIFLNMVNHDSYSEGFDEIIEEAARLKIGVLIYSQHPGYALGQRQMINVWIRNRAPDWKISWDIGNLYLSILVAYKLKRNWDAKIRLVTVVDNEEQKEQAHKFMSDLIDQARLPKTEMAVFTDNYNELIKKAPSADLNIFGLGTNPDFEFMERMVGETQTTCLFIRDSGLENIFA